MSAANSQQYSGRVLVFDDDMEVGRTVCSVAEAAGMESIAVGTPAAFFGTLRSWEPTHIVLDLMMPVMDGIEVVRQLATARSQAVIIIFSGVGSSLCEAAKRLARDHGLTVGPVLPKPFKPSDLRAALRPQGERRGAAITTARSDLPESIPDRRVQEALGSRRLSVGYSPIVRAANHSLYAIELQPSWQDANPASGNTVSLLRDAQLLGMSSIVTDHMLRQALSLVTTARWPECVRVTVNVGLHEANQADFSDRILEACRDAQVSAELLSIELTDTANGASLEDMTLQLSRLRMAGVRLVADGVGSSAMPMFRLAQLPFSELKLHPCIFSPFAGKTMTTVADGIVHMARRLDMRATACGITDKHSFDLARAAGCNHVQGEYVAAALPEKALPVWLCERLQASPAPVL